MKKKAAGDEVQRQCVSLCPPLVFCGEVVKGFGRGSTDLGCPTANIPPEPYAALLQRIENGVYFGFASVEGDPRVYGMAMNIGWSPYYKNEKKTVEVHLLHTFPRDFYGKQLRALALAYVRPELNFTSLDALIDAIQGDLKWARHHLQSERFSQWGADAFLKRQHHDEAKAREEVTKKSAELDAAVDEGSKQKVCPT